VTAGVFMGCLVGLSPAYAAEAQDPKEPSLYGRVRSPSTVEEMSGNKKNTETNIENIEKYVDAIDKLGDLSAAQRGKLVSALNALTRENRAYSEIPAMGPQDVFMAPIYAHSRLDSRAGALADYAVTLKNIGAL
jgi:hypothetical protein